MLTCDVVANVLDSDIVVNEFELQTHYYVHFWTNNLGKDVIYHIPISYQLISTITVLLQTWLWHWISHESRYPIKQRNQTNNKTVYIYPTLPFSFNFTLRSAKSTIQQVLFFFVDYYEV